MNAGMVLSDRLNRIDAVIDNHIRVWSSNPSFAHLAEVLQNDRHILSEKFPARCSEESTNDRHEPDTVRMFLLDYALERVAGRITSEHFTLFRDVETVQVILEDSYGFEDGQDHIFIPHQAESLKILIQCLLGRKSPADDKDVLCFLHLFGPEKAEMPRDQDRTMRFRSMIWFIYLAIQMIETEQQAICSRGMEYFRNKFRELLDRAIEGTIIDEDSRFPGFEDGKWEKTLFGWLQGEDRLEFVEKLKRQFNMENRIEHANRGLLADHRKCVIEQILNTFCE